MSFIDAFERDLVAAARRRNEALPAAKRARAPFGSLLLAGALCIVTAGSAAGGTLLALRGSAIPAPAPRDQPREQTPAAGTSAITDVRATDPRPGDPPWTVRIARSRTGLLCGTVGQLVGGRFGLIGLDKRFRVMPDRIVDACGAVRENAASLIGARVFDGRRPADVRTVVNGYGGSELRSVTITAGGRRIDVPVATGGVFASALPGYPEDLGIRVVLRFADGHSEDHPLGVSGFVVPDPAGGRAWRVEGLAFGTAPGRPTDPRSCASFRPAREVRSPATSPVACGILGGTPRHRTGYYFALRRIVPGTGGIPIMPDGEGNWGDHPPRTAVWGGVGEDVRAVTVTGPRGERRDLTIAPSRTFLAVYGPDVDPRELAVTITFRDGRTETRRSSTNLAPRRSR